MIPRLRMFAGPNGSGKSTLAEWLSKNYSVNLYHYVNADMMFAEISDTLKTACPLPMENKSLLAFASQSTFPERHKAFFTSQAIHIEDDFVVFSREAVNSYTIALLADFFRSEYLANRISFSCETVFSHPSKIELLKTAHDKGFRTYLYFVATECPEININRVATRVQEGGHDVPYEKIVERFQRCLDNVTAAIPHLDRGFFFDNSGSGFRYIAELNEGRWTCYTSMVPHWFIKLVYQKPES
ncbi:MAG: hypothetical protein IKO65_08230 [Victivallales bacterium]|nr:hypothetical protein [Victivallales bacterium]